MANKYRIPNKSGKLVFASFKDYVKFYGSDVVTKSQLTKKEANILRGIESSQNRLKNAKGQFISKIKVDQFKKMYKTKEIARERGIDENKLIQEIWPDVLKLSKGKIDFLPSKNFDTVLKIFNDNPKSTIIINGKELRSGKAALFISRLKSDMMRLNIGQNMILDNISVKDFFGRIEINSEGIKLLQKAIAKAKRQQKREGDKYSGLDDEILIEQLEENGLIGNSVKK